MGEWREREKEIDWGEVRGGCHFLTIA